jgi:hypothetical protein
MNKFRMLNKLNCDRAWNRKSTVLALYPELSRLYSDTSNCTKCKKKSRGKAILLHILNDPDLENKNKDALKQILPASFVDKLGG